MITKVQKWGNSQGLRLPKHVLEEVQIAVGDQVELKVQDGEILIRPVTSKRSYDLEALVDQMPDGYRVQEEDWGGVIGNPPQVEPGTPRCYTSGIGAALCMACERAKIEARGAP